MGLTTFLTAWMVGSALAAPVTQTQLSAAPRVAPGLSTPPELSLAHIRTALNDGTLLEAERLAERFATTHGRHPDAQAAWMAIAAIAETGGRHARAVDAYKHLRHGPLKELSLPRFAYALQQIEEHHRAIEACKGMVEHHAETRSGQACTRITAVSLAALGRTSAAEELAEAWDEENPVNPIGEQVQLTLAKAEMKQSPSRAARRLHKLRMRFQAPMTAMEAERLLSEIQAEGVETPAIDAIWEIRQRATSARDALQFDEAWSLYEKLDQMAEDDPSLRAWVDSNARTFGWRTRHWDFLADAYLDAYNEEGDPSVAWTLQTVLGRGGHWDQAAEWARLGMSTFGTTRKWRKSEEQVARTLMLSGDYEGAIANLDVAAARGGYSGRRAEFYAAFCAYMDDELMAAAHRLNAIVDENPSWETEARYWRAKTFDRLGQSGAAAADREWILENSTGSWYSVLLTQDNPRAMRPWKRDGRWPVPSADPRVTTPEALRGTWTAGPLRASVEAEAKPFALSWPYTPAPEPESTWQSEYELATAGVVPSYAVWPAEYRHTDPEELFSSVEDAFGDTWPELKAIGLLARVGLYEFSGPEFNRFYEDWLEAVKSRSHERHAEAKELDKLLETKDWRLLSWYTRDNHHLARLATSLSRGVEDPLAALELRRVGWPVAHGAIVWDAAEAYNVDPYMVLGLMRVESLYNANAVSRVGARGAMQIMPRTGYQLAALSHNPLFAAGDLERADVAIDYGIAYLDLLMSRFGGNAPLAIASYNAGPHNVSSWLQGAGYDMPIDAFVEHIPFRETRRYVKRVTGHWSTYLGLYGPEGATVVLPNGRVIDDPQVVNF